MAEGVTPKELDIELHDRVPDGQWEIVDVVFPATAGTDFQIPHGLSPASPEQVEYTVLRQATPGTVYEDRSATRTKWSPGFIILRSDTASWTGRLLLRVLKSPVLWTPGQSIVYTPPAGVTYPIALNKGGTAADLSATGPGYLKQASAGAAITVASSISAADIGSGLLALARGGTNADLSSTGGSNQVLKQASSGAAITVGTLASSNLSDSASIVLTSGSYSDPAWITALAGSKITGIAPTKVGANCTATYPTGAGSWYKAHDITVPGGTLATNGDQLIVTASMVMGNNANNKQWILRFNGDGSDYDCTPLGLVTYANIRNWFSFRVIRLSSGWGIAYGIGYAPYGAGIFLVSGTFQQTWTNDFHVESHIYDAGSTTHTYAEATIVDGLLEE